MISAGHGSLENYQFDVSKAKLEAAVMKVISANKNIYREPQTSEEYKKIYKEITKERNKEDKNGYVDTNYVDYYNDGKNYVTIKIKDKDYEFTLRYYGDEIEWKSSPKSEFFIVFARNKYGKGGGFNNNPDPKLVKQLVDVFKSEFVDKVAKELNIKYSIRE